MARASADGYTILVAPTSVETANPSLFKSNVLPSRDLTPVMGIGRMQMYVVAKPTIEAKTIKDLVALAKSQPGKLNCASSGTATPPYLPGELFKQSTGTFITHVPYRGSAPALQDVMAGQADFVFDPGIAFPHIKAGKVKLLGVASELVMRTPTIGLTRGLSHDRERYLQSYWSRLPDLWVHGDFASRDADGMWYVHGRSDDTLKIAGKRTGPAEIGAPLEDLGHVAGAGRVYAAPPAVRCRSKTVRPQESCR